MVSRYFFTGETRMLGTKLSIRAILGLVIGVMGLLLVAASVVSLVGVAGRYGEAERVAARAPVSQQFFKSWQALGLEGGGALTGLRAKGPANAVLTGDVASQRQTVED